MAWLKMLASEITSQPGRIAVLVSTERPVGVVVAASRSTGIAANKVLATC